MPNVSIKLRGLKRNLKNAEDALTILTFLNILKAVNQLRPWWDCWMTKV